MNFRLEETQPRGDSAHRRSFCSALKVASEQANVASV